MNNYDQNRVNEDNHFMRFINLSKNIEKVYFKCSNCNHEIDITKKFNEQVDRAENIFRRVNRAPNHNPLRFWTCDCDKCRAESIIDFIDYDKAKIAFNYNEERINNMLINEYFQPSQNISFINKK